MSVHSTRLNGDESTERAEASSIVEVSSTSDGEGPVVALWPRVERFETTLGTRLEDGQPGATRQRYDTRGRLLRESRAPRGVSTEVLDASTLSIFTLPWTYLGVPEEAVGVGARWVQELDELEYVLRIEEHISAMDDETIQVVRTVSLSESRGRISDVTATTNATYETATLFMRRAQIDSSYEFETTLPIENTPAVLSGRVEASRTIREVTP